MSIYCTLWQLRLPVWVPCAPAEKEADEYDTLGEFNSDDPGRPVRERWVEVWAQGVPGHIGHPDVYPEGDPYGDFLPPPVEDQDSLRAVCIIDEDHNEKEGQRYVTPLLVLTGDEYTALSFGDFLGRIEQALEARYRQKLPAPVW